MNVRYCVNVVFCYLIKNVYICRSKLILNQKMKYNCTKFYSAVLALVGGFMLSSCVGEYHDEVCKKPEEIVVGLCLGGNQTRTTMLSNGLTTEWLPGDRIAVWAKDQAGTYQLSNQLFELYGVDTRRGFFTSTLSESMPEGMYTYYCSYPSPLSVNGTQATFAVPSVQDGRVSGGADVMVADPVQHGPLTAIPEPEDHSGMSMSMNRILHQFRFYIPQSNTVLGTARITKMELNFPSEVCGKVVVDLANPTGRVALTEARRVITLDLAQPLAKSSESEGVYKFACVALAPAKFSEGQSLSIRAFTDDMIAVIDPINLKAKDCLAGHSTPVILDIKELKEFPYVIKFTLTDNKVGENVTAIKFTAPSGCKWPATGTNEYVYNPGRDIPVGSTVVCKFPDYEDYAAFSNQTITIELETENTISSSTAKIAAIPSGVDKHTSEISASVPYLLYQDFSSIGTYSDGHDNPKVGGDSDTYKGITELTSAGLPGWYGTRIGIQGGASARICCRYEHVLIAGAYYKGRIYTPQFSRIKDDKDVKIQVSFSYGSYREERKPVFGSKPDKSPVLYFGINTQDTVTNPDQAEGDIVDNITGMIAGSGYSSATPTSLMPMVIKGEVLDKENGSYTNLPKSKTLTIEGVDRYMRLGWIITTNSTASNTNANYWFYIDNIKVQIVK